MKQDIQAEKRRQITRFGLATLAFGIGITLLRSRRKRRAVALLAGAAACAFFLRRSGGTRATITQPGALPLLCPSLRLLDGSGVCRCPPEYRAAA
jgi:hypothetical protein